MSCCFSCWCRCLCACYARGLGCLLRCAFTEGRRAGRRYQGFETPCAEPRVLAICIRVSDSLFICSAGCTGRWFVDMVRRIHWTAR